jgi:phosphate:Na+ symporter
MKEILILLTGITFFLFGMMKLSVEVQQLFTVRIRDYIKYAVKRPVYGLVVGAVSTVFFQSSSATSVLVIGMVNAGLITFYQSLGIILGSDLQIFHHFSSLRAPSSGLWEKRSGKSAVSLFFILA